MPNLSVVIITFNEEKNIARCLASIETIADDIIVVDSFSTDKTEEICLQFKVRFIQHRFEGHIQQKNWALQQAKYPHVLSLDADEALDEKLKSQVNSIKENWTHITHNSIISNPRRTLINFNIFCSIFNVWVAIQISTILLALRATF